MLCSLFFETDFSSELDKQNYNKAIKFFFDYIVEKKVLTLCVFSENGKENTHCLEEKYWNEMLDEFFDNLDLYSAYIDEPTEKGFKTDVCICEKMGDIFSEVKKVKCDENFSNCKEFIVAGNFSKIKKYYETLSAKGNVLLLENAIFYDEEVGKDWKLRDLFEGIDEEEQK